MTLALDTLAYARRLREAGFTERQAEGQAEALAAAMTDTLATKLDIQELRRDVQDVRRDMQELATRRELDEIGTQLRHEMSQLGTQLRHEMSEFPLRMDVRFAEHSAQWEARFGRLETMVADLDRRLTLRMMMAIGVVAALVKVL
jgi:hypothetical protein